MILRNCIRISLINRFWYMNVKLLQKSFIRKQNLEFDDSKLSIVWKSLGSKDGMDIPFENILPNKFIVRKNSLFLFILSCFFYSLSVFIFYLRIDGESIGDFAELVWVFVASILLIIGIITRENYWRINLSNNNFIKIIKNSPNKSEVEVFIEKLFETRNEYLLNNYAYINPNIGYENQFNNLIWLRKMKVFDENSYQAKIEELDKMFSIQKNKIGF